jgi:hypothetical protein
MTAKALRALVGANDNLRQLYLELQPEHEIDADIVRHCGDVLTAMLGRLITSRTQVAQGEAS